MALLSLRSSGTSRRAQRRAHTKTLKAQAHAERKFREREARQHARRAEKDAKRAGRADAAVVAGDVADDVTDEPRRISLTPKQRRKAAKAEARGRVSSVKSYLGVARLLAPALAPLAYRAVTEIRGRVDLSRARKLGVGVEQLSSYTGYGAALSARIAGLENSLDSLVEVRGGKDATGSKAATGSKDTDAETFRTDTRARLTELSTAVHAAERMPTPRRKAAHTAVGQDLDQIDAELLRRLGVR